MKITVLKGSPNINGSSNILADNSLNVLKKPDIQSRNLILLMQTFHHAQDVCIVDMKENAS